MTNRTSPLSCRLKKSGVCLLVGGVVSVLVVSAGAQPAERGRDTKQPGMDLSLLPGWQLLTYNGCRIAVPAAWHAENHGSLLLSTDGSSISMRTTRISDWAAHKARIKAALGQVNVVHEDDDQRIWLEIGAAPRIQHYVAAPGGANGACSAILQLRPPASTVDETVRRIVQSVGPVQDHLPDTVR
jgi:hypothetical protein